MTEHLVRIILNLLKITAYPLPCSDVTSSILNKKLICQLATPLA